MELRTVVNLPPRYSEWAAAAGLPLLSAAFREHAVREGEPSRAVLERADVRLWITSPEDGLRVLRDPETPEDQATLALRAVVEPAVSQLVWYVDGRPYEVVDPPYTARLRLVPGAHVIEARLPTMASRSGRVRVLVE